MMTFGRKSNVLQHVVNALQVSESSARSDGELLTAWLGRRDEFAFEAIVRRHGPMVFGVCRRILRNLADAEDAFQVTFLVLGRKAASVAPREMLGNWLYGVACRTALKARTAEQRRRMREKVVSLSRAEAADEQIWDDVKTVLDQELSGLPDKYRVPIVLCDLEGKSRKEAAQHLKWKEGTLSGRLARGRVLLARRMTRHGFTLTSGVLGMMLLDKAAVAAVPTSLLGNTVRAVTLVAAGQAVAGVVPVQTAALLEGVLKAMLISKLKVVSALVLAVGILGAGAGFFKPAADAGEGEQPTQAATKQIKTKDAGTKNKAVTRHTGKLDQTMAVVLDIDFQDMPLKDILDNFRKTYGMNVIIDKPALNDAGLSLDGSITLSLDKVPLKTALKHILHDVSLTYRIEDDILIVSPQQENNLLTEIYAVEELVMHQGDDKTQEVALIRIITSTVMPKTWQTIGGTATIEFFPVGNSLVVNQTEEGHERIKALLEKLRAAKAKNDERRPQA